MSRELKNLRIKFIGLSESPRAEFNTDPNAKELDLSPPEDDFVMVEDLRLEKRVRNENEIPSTFRDGEESNGATLTTQYITAKYDLPGYHVAKNFGPGKPFTQRLKWGRTWVYRFDEVSMECMKRTIRKAEDELGQRVERIDQVASMMYVQIQKRNLDAAQSILDRLKRGEFQ